MKKKKTCKDSHISRRGWCLSAAERGTWHVPLVIHEEGDTVIRWFIAEFSLHYIELRRSDSLCKSYTSPMKYLAGLNIWNVANTAATNSAAVMKTCPIGEPFSTTAATSHKFPLILICCFAALVGKCGTRWDYDSEWGTHSRRHLEHHGAPHLEWLPLSPRSLFNRI